MKLIYSFFKSIAKTINIMRLFIINVLFFAILAAIIFVINLDRPALLVAENSTLHLNFTGNIVEQAAPADFAGEISKKMISSNENQNNEYQIDKILNTIHRAQQDPKISAILLELDGLDGAAINHIADIGKALNDFKSTGKSVTAVADNYSQTQYLLASYADKIYLNPQGMVLLPGYSVYRLYFKEALDKLLITPHIFKVGTYKSFVEPFTTNKMSEASKLANKNWLDQLWKNYIDTILFQRKDNSKISVQSISPTLKQLKSSLIKASGNSAVYALQVGLVDDLKNRNDVIDKLKNQTQTSGHKLNLVSYADYLPTLADIYAVSGAKDQIAVVHASGEILSGTQPSNVIGGDSFSQLLETALNDNQIKAVVIRIDSPGGSAFASEKIRQHILALKKADKKVVVSMASVAASGGYWIASAADYIIATPTTLTGSIGIFGMYASADKALNNFGIFNDGIGTTELSSFSPTRALNPELAEIIQLGIENGYQQFLEVVAQGRNMTVAEVDKIAQGRVWTGVDAKSLGLIDELGNLQDAINTASRLASLQDYGVKIIQPVLSTKQHLINELLLGAVEIIPQSLHINAALYQTLNAIESQTAILTRFNDPQGRYAYCPMCVAAK
ncbi:signal peptide peptidase SppA, 67K type [Psychromonas ingrahamii 37]|uniref:Signal peptide peptidase SppA, 67K type n=1 Tax=Psychromonas ingrahamii (strain DSM 17664 / CCUG 51855 / 37) TaxID=357804 RepID=A1SW86_PSYIN|nr:signal peptide peptidase SppA [Psychromonas ingrahamii]ABM03751.1 signal peptide peptidase SppA, 67K type [Psychromonas ingrahamii 37]